MIKRNLKNVIKIIFLVIILMMHNNTVYAGMAKWQAYPEWGNALKFSIIILYVAILITIIGIIIKYILQKLNKKVEIVDKIMNIIVLSVFEISVISRIIVDANIYTNAIMYLRIGIIVAAIVSVLIINIKILSSKKFYIIILGILIVLLITNKNVYPNENYNDVLQMNFENANFYK